MNVREKTLLEALPTGLHIDGRWVDGADGTFDVHDPATGEVLARVADASAGDGISALDAADAARWSWARTAPRERGEVLRRTWQLVQDRAEDLALLMTLEMGKPIAESRAEVAYGGEFLRWFAEEAVRITGRYNSSPEGHGQMTVSRRPVGPCYLVTPWNFPLAMATRKIAPAVAAGCTVVVKPAELTPLTTLALTELLTEAGLPPGVVNVVTTTRPEPLSDALLADRRLRKLSFTGSTPVGVSLLRKAAGNVLRTSMELGGNAPFLVFDDADLDRAVDGAMLAKFRNVGQACTAANRFLVHRAVADEFVARLTERVTALTVGPGTEPGVEIGPLVTARAVEGSARLVDDAVSGGATLCTGGRAPTGPGNFFTPTLLDGVTADMAVSAEEIFAPIVGIQRFDTEEEAVALANATDFGLVGYVFTRDAQRGARMAELIETGMLGLNTGVVSNAAAPFGGVKRSGLGREGGAEGIGEYLETVYTLSPSPFSPDSTLRTPQERP